jgi:membrane associated rhomboid family serine protease
VLPVSLVCLFWEAGNAALIMTPAGVFRGQVWRLMTSLINQGGFLNLAFTLLVLAMTGPATERQLGSMRFLLFLVAYGVLINLVFGIITVRAGSGSCCTAVAPLMLLLRCWVRGECCGC